MCCDESVVSSMSLCCAGRLVRELAVVWRWLVLCRLCPELELRCVGCLVHELACGCGEACSGQVTVKV